MTSDSNNGDGDQPDETPIVVHIGAVIADLDEAVEVRPATERKAAEGASPPVESETDGDAVDGAETVGNGGSKKDTREHKATRVYRYAHASGMELWLSTGGDEYASIPVEREDPETGQTRTHFENHALKSARFENFLLDLFFAAEKNPPGTVAIREAIQLLENNARRRGRTYKLNVRVGEQIAREGDPIEELWIDRGDSDWTPIRVTGDGWSIISPNSIKRGDMLPVKFVRSPAMRALPQPCRDRQDDPDRGEDANPIWDLKELLNPDLDDDAFVLILAWMIGAYHPRGPYAGLALDGVQGSGKSTGSRTLRKFIDPNEAPLRTASKNEEDLAVQAENAWLITLDNQSSISGWLSDALSRVSTGAGMSTRKLYDNKGEVVFSFSRPMLLNGIKRVLSKDDLADRFVMIQLPAIKELTHLAESDLATKFSKSAPAIFAAILDGLVYAVRDHKTMERAPRMADFTMWVEAALQGLGFERGAFTKLYLENRGAVVEEGIADDPIKAAILQLLEECCQSLNANQLTETLRQVLPADKRDPHHWPMRVISDLLGQPERVEWRSTPSGLYAVLMKISGDPENKSNAWPVSSNQYWNWLVDRKSHLFRARGIEIERATKSRDRGYIITCPYPKSNA